MGIPLEIETDCQALRDHLLNLALISTHARWRDAVLTHNIVDVHHRPGCLNVVADGLSWKFVNAPKEQGVGHEWTISKDWEAWTNLANDILVTNTASLEPTLITLRSCFTDEKVFIKVIDSMLELENRRWIRQGKGEVRVRNKRRNSKTCLGRTSR